MNISLPDSLKSFVDEQVNQGSYGTSSEYVRELIRKDQERLRGLLIAGAASVPAPPIDPAYFETLRVRVRKAGARVTAKLVVPRELANRDIEDAVAYYLYAHIGRHPATGSPRYALQ